MIGKERYRDIVNAVPAMICEFLPDSTLTYVNKAYCDYFGKSVEELLGKRFLTFLPQEDVQSVQEMVLSLTPENPTLTIVHKVSKAGEIFWHEWTNRAFFDEHGAAVRFQAVGQDTTARKMVEMLLQSRLMLREYSLEHSLEEFLRRTLKEIELLTSSRISFFRFVESENSVLDVEELIALNCSLQDGFSKRGIDFSFLDKICSECISKRCSFMSNDDSVLDGGLKRVIATPVMSQGEVFAILGVGDKKGRYTRFDAGALCQLATTAVDATIHKMMDNSLRRSKDRAEAANRAKSEFLANMSHEIRTPINGIMGMLQLMQTTELDEEQREYAGYAIESSKRLSSLLTDILDLTMVEAEQLVVQIAPFDVADTVEAVRQLFQQEALQQGLELTFSIDPLIPHELMGDAVRLQQILINLVGNSIKFTESGKVEVEIYSQNSLPDDLYEIMFVVRDTGIGIPEKNLSILFEPFTQGEGSYKRKFQGAGLGLAICRRLVSLLGGNISVESEEGEGSTFYFCLPLRRIQGSLLKHDHSSSEDRRGQLRILFADDDRVTQLATVRLLEKMGHKVSVAENGRVALDLLQKDTFDLVLMDIQMPVMDGVEAMKEIRAGNAGADIRNIPIVVLTAYAMVGDEGVFLKNGADGYLAKPFFLEDLKDTINRFTEEH